VLKISAGCVQDTYRYHGHSISDPGSTYRTRDEIQGIRRARDPIEHIRTLLQEHSFADSSELKRIEKEIKKVSSVMPLTLHACRCLNSRM
jgi:TPP-dependent pyruvate/acetoin dehydrogenase alpha subunit